MPGFETRREEADRNFTTGFRIGIAAAIAGILILACIGFLLLKPRNTPEEKQGHGTVYYDTMTAKNLVSILLAKREG